MERRAIRDRVALDRHQVMRNLALKGDLSEWLEHRMKSLEVSHDRKSTENQALMRNLLRGSKRKKRAIISELQSGSLRRALSEDELGPGDEDSADIENSSAHSSVQKRTCREKVSKLEANKPYTDLSSHPILVDLHLSSDQRRRRHAGDEEIKNVTSNLESLTVQSEFGFPSVMSSGHKRYLPMGNVMGNDQKQHYNLSYYDSYDNRCSLGDNESKTQQYNFDSNQDLEVSDHPHLYQNTLQVLQDHKGPTSNSLFIDRSKRNSVRLVQ